MLAYLSADIICSEKRTVFGEHNSRKTVILEEQIMSTDNISEHIFAPNVDYRVCSRDVIKFSNPNPKSH